MTDQELIKLLQESKTIAVVGLSDNPARPSFGVSRFLQRQGYRVIPVNPAATEILGERVYPSLQEIPEAVDIVDIFRRSEAVPAVVDEALLLPQKPRCIWMQEGIINEEAAQKAQAAGIPVVMNKCMLKELGRLFPVKS